MHTFVCRYLQWAEQKVYHGAVPSGHIKFSPDWCFGLLKKREVQENIGHRIGGSGQGRVHVTG